MAFAAIAYTIPQYEDFPNYWMKAFDQGTTTPKVMAIDPSGSPTVAKLQLSGSGHVSGITGSPITVGNALVIPYIDGAYDLWLFPTEAEADANDTSNAIQLSDNINAGVDASTIQYTSTQTVGERLDALNVDDYSELAALLASDGSDLLGENIKVTDGGIVGDFIVKQGVAIDEGGVLITQNRGTTTAGQFYADRDFKGAKHSKWYESKGDDSTNDTANLQKWIDLGGSLYWDSGTYITDQLVWGSNITMMMHKDTIVKENTGYASTDCIFSIGALIPSPTTGVQSSDVIIYGNNALLQGLGATDEEGRMGVRINNGLRIHIYDLRTTRMSGDGFYIGSNNAANSVLNFSEDIRLVGCEGDDNNRQGLSILDAKNVWIIDFVGKNTGTTSPNTNGPWGGIDIEPDGVWSRVENINIIRPHLHNNAGPGLLIDLSPTSEAQINPNIATITVESPYCHNNGGPGCRVSESAEIKSTVIVNDLDSRSNTMWGLQLSNLNQPSYTEINRPTLTDNAQSSTAGDYNFPGDTNASARQVQMICYTNSVTARDAFNGGLGVVQSNIRVNDAQFYTQDVDVAPWFFGAYSGASGSNNGYTIDTVINRPRIWRKSGFSAVGTIAYDANGGPNDIIFNDVREFSHSTFLYEEVTIDSTGNVTLTNDNQDKVQTNTGASGTIRYTMPAAQGAAYNRQHYIFEVVASQTLEIIGAGNDDIAFSGGNRLPDAGTPELIKSSIPGSRIRLNKISPAQWVATLEEGFWEVGT